MSDRTTVDIGTTYLGLRLANPLIASSSPLTGDLDSLKELEAAGIAAVVLPSLFEEQIEHEATELSRLAEFGAESFAEALGGYFPDLDDYNTGPDEYLREVAAAKAALEIPVVASLNGTTRGGWIRYAKKLVDAGADALELNIYLIPTDPYATGHDVEQRYLDLVRSVKDAVSVPLAVKIGPYFSSLGHMARQFVDVGADALVLFNRFYQPDIDLDNLEVTPNLKLSDPVEVRLPLRWVAILSGKVRCDLAVTTGVHTPTAAIKALLVGAKAVMMASALLKNGPEHVGVILDGLRTWLEEHDYESVEQMRGSMSMEKAPHPDQYVRANYMKMLTSYTGVAP
jgi:dihydroorotate dehydrogenase (fumarate)